MENLLELKNNASELIEEAKSIAQKENEQLSSGEKAILRALESLYAQNQIIIKLLKDVRSPTNII